MQHTKQCASCGASFTAARADARYCSPRCRTAAARKRTVPDDLHRDLIKARDSIDHVLERLNEKRTA